MERKIPKATLSRYPKYLKALRKLQKENIDKVMSKELAELVNIEPTTIRRDLSLLKVESLGKQGYGYDVNQLINVFNSTLGLDIDENIVLIGAGNLGSALMNYNKWDNVVGKIACAFDKDPNKLGMRFNVPVYDIKDLKEKMPEGCRIAILVINGDGVQDVVDELVACGIVGIVDFTHSHIQVPSDVIVKSVDVVSSIQELVLETNELKK